MNEDFKIEKVGNGRFDVINPDGSVDFQIFNGNAGISGRGNNEYAIMDIEKNKSIMIGTLQKAKKVALLGAKQKWSKKQ
jgi:hypothetical protein